MKRTTIVAALSLALVGAPWLTGSAAAVSTCDWDPGSGTLSITADDNAGLTVSGSDILLEGTSCDAGATTATVDLIEIDGVAGDNDVVLLLGGGPFAPGAEAETDTPEIEIALDLGAGNDQLLVNGDDTAEDITIGALGATLNGDDDVDVTLAGVEFVQLLGQDGDDSLSGGGSEVVGAGFAGALLIGGGPGDDTITGGPTGDELGGGDDQDVLIGLGGVDNLLGGDGPDLLRGGPRSDDLDGGPGADTADYSDATAGVTVDLVAGASGGSGRDDVVSLEHVVGSAFADEILGNSLANELLGRGGNDRINGRGGADAMDGEGGPRDLVSFAGSPSGVTVSLQAATATGWGDDTLSRFERIGGSSGNDRLTGSGDDDELLGGAGSDTLRGLGGADRLRPGPGNDVVRGDPGKDTLDLTGTTRGVMIDLATGRAAGEGTDMLSGIEDAIGSRFGDRLSGNAAANALSGRAGPDVIGGRGGPDLLHGNGGNDALNGGPGVDTCFQGAGSGPRTSCENP